MCSLASPRNTKTATTALKNVIERSNQNSFVRLLLGHLSVLSPILFTLHTADFKHNSKLCHMQKFSNNTAVVACIKENEEGEYRKLVSDFVEWCQKNQLILNTSKTKEIVLDFRRQLPTTLPVCIEGEAVEIVPSYKYLRLTLDNKLDWSLNTDHIYKKGQSRLYFLWRLASFNICTKLLQMFYNSVVASVLFFAVACWGGSGSKRNIQRLNKLIKKAGSVVGLKLDSVEEVTEQRTLSRLRAIMNNADHPLYSAFNLQRSTFRNRLRSLNCSTTRYAKSFVPQAIRLHNSQSARRRRGRRRRRSR